jgi:hypothetical protein
MLEALRANRAIQILAGAALLLAALAAAVFWQLEAPRRALEAARTRWNASPVEQYRLVVSMRGWGGCHQDAQVRRERVTAITSNSCRYYSPRTVTSLFAETERFLRSPEFGSGCRRGIPGRDCACYAPYEVVAEYDQQYGYPTLLQVRVGAYTPNRTHLHYYRYLLQHGREPVCGGPVEPVGRHIVVERFEPLP